MPGCQFETRRLESQMKDNLSTSQKTLSMLSVTQKWRDSDVIKTLDKRALTGNHPATPSAGAVTVLSSELLRQIPF